MRYTIDTNILVHLLTGSDIGRHIVSKFEDEDPFIIISIVTKAEITSIALQRSWGKKKLEALKTILSDIRLNKQRKK